MAAIENVIFLPFDASTMLKPALNDGLFFT